MHTHNIHLSEKWVKECRIHVRHAATHILYEIRIAETVEQVGDYLHAFHVRQVAPGVSMKFSHRLFIVAICSENNGDNSPSDEPFPRSSPDAPPVGFRHGQGRGRWRSDRIRRAVVEVPSAPAPP